MKKRLRKKKHLGEFTEWGVEVAILIQRETDFDRSSPGTRKISMARPALSPFCAVIAMACVVRGRFRFFLHCVKGGVGGRVPPQIAFVTSLFSP